MGFYIKDLYIARVPKYVWHDKLTNPPTIPETSPVIRVTQLSPRFTAVTDGQNGGGSELPADDTVLPPSPITPIVMPHTNFWSPGESFFHSPRNCSSRCRTSSWGDSSGLIFATSAAYSDSDSR